MATPRAAPVSRDTFGRLLRELRLRAGFSQEQLAELAGMSVTGIGALERGLRRAPYRATVDLLADALALPALDRAALEDAAARARGRTGREPEPLPVPTPHLPAPVSSLVGREDDVSRVLGLLERFRLVTVTGSGGVGKTRLALAVAKHVAEQGNAVCFVDLTPLSDGGFIAAKIAASLNPPLADKPDSIGAVAEALAPQTLLLVLDTCEHLIDDVAAGVRTITERTDRVTVLATSRERLNIASEALYRLPSLPAEVAAGLFAERAHEADAGMPFTRADLALALDICRRVDGIPLAIELTAARAPALGLATLHAHLEEHLSMVAGRRDLPQRQQTIVATIAWSYDLLAEPERRFLRRLAVFSGGFTFHAADAVCNDGTLGQPTLALLSSLVDKSLVDVVRRPDAMRYRLLDAVRAYALAALRSAGEGESAFRRHAEWVAALGDPFASDAARMTYAEFKELEPEIDNVRAAITWALAAESMDDRALTGHIVFGLRNLWHMTGDNAGQRRWIDLGLERIDERTHPREVGQLLRAFILRSWNEAGVVPVIERAIALFERVGDRRSIAALHSTLAFIFGTLGRFAEADESAARAADLMQQEGMSDTMVYAAFLTNRAGLRTEEGRLEDAKADVAAAARVAADKDRYFVVSRCMPRAITIEYELGNLSRAMEIAKEMRASEFSASTEVGISALEAIALVSLTTGDVEQAVGAARELLDLVQRPSAPWCHLAAIVAMRGRIDAAARLFGFIDALYAQGLLPRNKLEQRSYEILRSELSRHESGAAIESMKAQGARFTPRDAGEEAVTALAP